MSTGVWRIDVEISRDALTGKRRRVARTVHGSRADAELVAAKLKIAGHSKVLVVGKTSATSVGELMEKFLAAMESGEIELAPTTVVTSRSAIKTMDRAWLPDGQRFGAIRLTKLTWREIEQLYAVLKDGGRSVDWVRRCATVLSQSLEYGKKRGLLESNPSKDSRRPKSKRTKPYSPTAPEVKNAIREAAGNDPEISDIAIVLASTGMRRGELLALRWCDIDLGGREINVSWSVVDGGTGVGIVRKPTKTSDWRDVPLTDGAMAAFGRQRDRITEALGTFDPEHYVFCGDGGPTTAIRPDRLSKRWPKARGDSKITLTHLRHFAATTMLDAGESYRTVADILGNSENTLRLHYDGRTDVGKRKAVSALEI